MHEQPFYFILYGFYIGFQGRVGSGAWEAQRAHTQSHTHHWTFAERRGSPSRIPAGAQQLECSRLIFVFKSLGSFWLDLLLGSLRAHSSWSACVYFVFFLR